MKKVSVCVLAYKSAYLEEVIQAMQSQTYNNITIEIRDDCSPENLKGIVEKYVNSDNRISYIRNEKNLNELHSWAKAVKTCDAEYLVTLHDDDFYSPVLIERYLEILEQFRDIVAVSSLYNTNSVSGNIVSKMSDYVCTKSDKYYKTGEYIEEFASTLTNPFAHMAMMIRVEPLKEIIDILDKKDFSETVMILMINSKYPIYVIHEALIGYRQHEQQTSRLHDVFKIYDHHEMFRRVYETTKNHLGEKKSRKVLGWAQNYSFQYKALNTYDSRICEIVERLNKCLDEPMNIYYSVCFAMQLLYLKENTPKYTKYKIWGAGANGKLTKKIIDLMLPNYVFTGYMDKFKTGKFDEWDIMRLDEYDFQGSNYIFISHNTNYSGFESLGMLVEMGLKMPEDFMLGYGFPMLVLIQDTITFCLNESGCGDCN